MKKFLIIAIPVLVLAGLIGLARLRSGEPPEEAVETRVAVQVGKITRVTLRGYVTAYGVVEPQPPGERQAASALVAPAVAGVVTRVHCSEGERVAKGALLFELDSRAADVAAEKAQEEVGFAEKTLERQKKLLQVDGTSQKTFQEAERVLQEARADLAAARTQQALRRVEAPLAGTVSRILVKPGEAVDLSTTMAQLVDLERLVVSAGVPSAELAPLRVGQRVEVRSDPAGSPIEGSLLSISPQVDPKTGTALIRISLPGHGELRPGVWVTLRIVTEERRDSLAAPEEAVVKNAAGSAAVALVRGDEAALIPVKTGLRDGGWIEVEGEGLTEGAAVVTRGAYGLPERSKIRILGR